MQTTIEKKTYWTNHLREWKASGLTQIAYCECEKTKAHQLTYQKNKLDGKAKNVGPSRFASVAVLPSPSPDGLIITFPCGIQLSGIDSSNLSMTRQLVEQLK